MCRHLGHNIFTILSEAINAKHADGQIGAAVVGEVFAHHRGELEAVPGEAGRQRHVRMIGVQVDDKVTIGCQCVGAYAGAAGRAIDRRHI